MTRPRSHPQKSASVGFALLFLLASAGFRPLAAQDQRGLSLDSLLSVPVSAASKHLQSVREAPASVTLITAEEIAEFGWTDLSQLINAVRGFYSSYDRNYTYIGVRGFGRPTDYNNRLLLLLNGHTLNEGIWGSTSAGRDVGIDLRSLERVEIVRGPGSALYGNSALFAVINLVTKDGAALDGAHLYGNLGSFGEREGSLMAGKELVPGLDVVVNGLWGRIDGQTLYYPEFADDSATGGTIRNLDYEERRGGFVRVAHERTGLVFQTRYVWRTKGMPTASFFQIPGARPSFTTDEMVNAELKWRSELTPALEVNARGYADGYWYSGTYQYGGPAFEEEATNRIYGGEASLQWDFDSRNRLTVGGEYRDNPKADYWAPPTNPTVEYLVPYHVTSVYAQHELELNRWLTLTGGLRYDDNSRSGGHLSPRAAVVMRPDQATSIKLLYGSAFRAPSVSESEYQPTGGKRNRDLEPEKINTYELVLQRQVSRGLLLSAGAFAYHMHDLIDLVVDPSDSLLVRRNLSKVDARGVYAEAEWHNGGGLHFNISGSYIGAEDTDTDVRLTNSPDVLLKAGLAVPLPSDLTLGVQSRYESSRRTVVDTDTDPFVLADLNLHWRPRGRMNRLEASLRVNNLFDTEYGNPGGLQHAQAQINQDGRTLRASVGVRF